MHFNTIRRGQRTGLEHRRKAIAQRTQVTGGLTRSAERLQGPDRFIGEFPAPEKVIHAVKAKLCLGGLLIEHGEGIHRGGLAARFDQARMHPGEKRRA